MTLDTITSGTGRNVVYTLKVETDPGAKGELQKFKQSVQEAFKDIGAKQAEARDQAMRGPQVNIERMRSQFQQESRRRQYDVLRHAEELNSGRDVQAGQMMFQAGLQNHAQKIDSSAGDASPENIAPAREAGSLINSIPATTAGNFRGSMARAVTNGDRKFGDVQKSIAAVMDALAKMAQALGSADQESNSRRNLLLQRANRDAAFG